jgi:hypoxanthine phosphoribosyltransferase
MEFYELISRKEIDAKINHLSNIIKHDFNNTIYALTVLEGARVFSDYLIEELVNKNCIVENDYIKLSSYNKGTESSGTIILKQVPQKDFKGKSVLVIEDIIDTGLTLTFLKKYLIENGAKQVSLCTLLDKPQRRTVELKADYAGFEIPNKFVVGFGIDFDEKFRELPSIYYLE